MGTDLNLVISFHSTDNLPGTKGKGWVSMFVRYLKETISRISSINVNIYLHSDVDVSSVNPYSNTGFLICIPSIEYFKSDLFQKESEKLLGHGETLKNGENRIFKVERKSIELKKYPELIRNLLPYKFYSNQIDKHSNPGDWEPEHSLVVLDLAHDIIRKASLTSNAEVPDHGGTSLKKVYLALTGNDLLLYREIIKRELERQQIEVYPSSILSGEVDEVEKLIKQQMSDCTLSIHLIGQEYGEIPVGSDRSIVDIQNKVALELSSIPFHDPSGSQRQFSRLLWIYPELTDVSEKQKNFIENIKRDTRALKEDEILQVPFDELREIIQNKIIKAPRLKGSSYTFPAESQSKGVIYLIYESYDVDITQCIKVFLLEKGFEVISSVIEGDQISVRELHQENLKKCDASLIVCGKVNYEWINTKLQDLIKAPGFGRTRPFKAKALYITKEKYQDIHEKLLNLEDSLILPGSEPFSPDSFFGFLNKFSA